MQIKNEQLQQEAAFADSHYRRYVNDLAINARMFAKYSHPKDMWDWRQFGAKLLGSVRGANLLDLGCGMGEESIYFAKLGALVTSIDISRVGIELTTKRAAYNGLSDRVRALVMQADHTEFPDGFFDVIHGFGILHHIGLDEGLAEVKRLLKPGGRALFFEHMGNCPLIERLRRNNDYTEYEKPLRWVDVVAHRGEFTDLVVKPFHILTRFRSFIPTLPIEMLRRCDYLLLAGCPPLKYLAGGLIIYLER